MWPGQERSDVAGGLLFVGGGTSEGMMNPGFGRTWGRATVETLGVGLERLTLGGVASVDVVQSVSVVGRRCWEEEQEGLGVGRN